MPGLLEGRSAAITGAAQGIGAAIARAFAAQGATVWVSDVNEAGAKQVAEEIGGHAVACDVTKEDQVQALVQAVVDGHGKLDVMVANAGIADMAPLTEMTAEQWQRVIDVNLTGVFHSIKHAGAAMAAAGGGNIITMASVTATGGSPLIGNYAAAKAGAVNLTQTAAVELKSFGVRCNAILPGFADTDLVRDNKATFEELLDLPAPFDDVIAQKQGRYGTPEDIAKLAVFVASDRTAFNTATPFVIDGGMTASLL